MPMAPVVSNHDGNPYSDGEGWQGRLPEHVRVPVRWRRSMETMATLGATSFIEVGHGSMIAGLAKRTVPDIPVHGVGTPADLELLVEAC
jgi:[acyl-carrier-protein] S-malonyltransferase